MIRFKEVSTVILTPFLVRFYCFEYIRELGFFTRSIIEGKKKMLQLSSVTEVFFLNSNVLSLKRTCHGVRLELQCSFASHLMKGILSANAR